MRITFRFGLYVLDEDSDREIPVPVEFHEWQYSADRMESYLDAQLADEGVVGGEIRAVVDETRTQLEVAFWLPSQPSSTLIRHLQADTIGQLEDGIGEGGFECELDGRCLLLFADTSDVVVELREDGRMIAPPSKIAISARDGDMASLGRELEEATGEVNALHQGFAGLHLAILFGRMEAIELLLKSGADANQVDVDGKAPLHLCALSNSLNEQQSCLVAELLLAAGADPAALSEEGNTAKDYALVRGKVQMANLLSNT